MAIFVAGGDHSMRASGDGFLVRLGIFAVVFDAGAVVEEIRHRQALQQVGDAAHVVLVEVGDEQRVDFLDAGGFGGGGDAIGVAPAIAGVSGVDQQRLAGGRDDQRGLASFDIDEINVQRLGGLGGDG